MMLTRQLSQRTWFETDPSAFAFPLLLQSIIRTSVSQSPLDGVRGDFDRLTNGKTETEQSK
ncbi:MAG: hypothetical protein CMM29_10330 [Rhodospirillaceae bacterium]|nr:hypothetical protein [Rhodospirillaceae bacterium]